jgi:hypothetical protein
MSQQSPGFAFANNLVNPEPTGRQGPPPAAVDPRSQAAAATRPGMVFTEQKSAKGDNSRVDNSRVDGSRPDISAVRGSMFKEAGIDLNNNFESPNRRPPVAPRQEMSGPKNANLDSILSGLKTKNVDIHENRDDDSMVSVSSLKDLNGASIPSGRRRKGSDKNIVSLDL